MPTAFSIWWTIRCAHLRKRQVIESFPSRRAQGDLLGHPHRYRRLPCSATRCPARTPVLALAETPTRLKRLDERLQEKLINWGYAVTDAALRKHVDPTLADTDDFPYPAAAV